MEEEGGMWRKDHVRNDGEGCRKGERGRRIDEEEVGRMCDG